MMQRPASLMLVLVALCGIAGAHSFHAWRAAEARVESAMVSHEAAASRARKIRDLRRASARASTQERPEQNLIALVHSVLDAAAIQSDAFKKLEPESEMQIEGGPAQGYLRQSFALSLQALTPREIGAFLAEWSRQQQVWIPSRVELHHVRGQAPGSSGNRYHLRLRISAAYLREGPAGV